MDEPLGLAKPALKSFLHVTSEKGTPPAYARALGLGERADRAAADGRYGEAASLFMEAASLFVAAGPDVERFGAAFKAAREVAYYNALTCFRAAGDDPGGRRALEAATARDGESATAIRALLAR